MKQFFICQENNSVMGLKYSSIMPIYTLEVIMRKFELSTHCGTLHVFNATDYILAVLWAEKYCARHGLSLNYVRSISN